MARVAFVETFPDKSDVAPPELTPLGIGYLLDLVALHEVDKNAQSKQDNDLEALSRWFNQ